MASILGFLALLCLGIFALKILVGAMALAIKLAVVGVFLLGAVTAVRMVRKN